MTNLAYLPAIIPTTIVAYSIVVLLVLFFFNRQERKREEDALAGSIVVPNQSTSSLFESYFSVSPFQHTYQSVNKYGGNILLLVTRLASFGYICGISGLWNFVRNDWSDLFYFTLWNVVMISVYYGMAVAASIIGLIFNSGLDLGSHTRSIDDSGWLTVSARPGAAYWSIGMHRFGFCVQILFEVAGGTALFVTIIAFTFLNPQFEFWNVSDHFVTSISFLVEMSQNSMVIRWHHVVLNMLWALIYLFYIWPAVATGKVTNWPYDFLRTESAACFGWYFMLFFLNAIFYFIWYYLSRFKYEYAYSGSELARTVLPLHLAGTGVTAASTASSSVGTTSNSIGGISSDYSHEIAAQNSPIKPTLSSTGGVGSGSNKVGIDRIEK